MTRIRILFLLLIVIGPVHIAEQLLTSIEEFYSIRALAARYYDLFDPAAADHASVLLITMVWTFVSLLLYALLREGTARLVVVGLVGLFSAAEVHHVIASLAKGGYDPGVVTCVPYSVLGWLLMAAVWGEFRRNQTSVIATERRMA